MDIFLSNLLIKFLLKFRAYFCKMSSAYDIFRQNLKNYKKIELDEEKETLLKRRLPKVIKSDCEDQINTVNEILSKEFDKKETGLEELHTLVYCGAKTVIKLCKKSKIEVYYEDDIPNQFPKNDEDKQRKLFKISPTRFHRLLFPKKKNIEDEIQVSEEELTQFWSDLWKKQKSTDEKNTKQQEYLKEEKKRVKEKNAMEDGSVSMEELGMALKRLKDWSFPGIDGLQYFWYKKFSCVKKHLLRCINKILSGEEEWPHFLSVGLTELQQKESPKKQQDPKNSKQDSEEKPKNPASNFRPITHLPSIYKIIARCIYQKIYRHFEKNDILPIEQTGGRKGCFGTRKALIIDSIALDQEEIFGYYVDFTKAFDSVPHDWLQKLLKIYKVHSNLRGFLEKLMENLKVRLYLKAGVVTKPINLERGILQGDPLSVLFFWTILTPLSFILEKKKNLGLGLKKGGYVTHVFYMDDLKIYSSDKKNLDKIFEEVKIYIRAVNMEINETKSKPFHLSKTLEEGTSAECIKKKKREPASEWHFIRPSYETKYLGYTQSKSGKPTQISHQEALEDKFYCFEKKIRDIDQEINLDSKDKLFSKKKYIFSYIFNTFGFLDWTLDCEKLLKIGEKPEWLSNKNSLDCFKNTLKISQKNAKKKKLFKHEILEQIEDIAKKNELIKLKLICEMIKIRSKLFEEKKKWDLIRDIAINDDVTTLKLSEENNENFVEMILQKMVV